MGKYLCLLIIICIALIAGCSKKEYPWDLEGATGSGSVSFSDGSFVTLPKEVAVSSNVSGDFDGVLITMGENHEVSGFISKTNWQDSYLTADSILTNSIATLEATSDISSINAVSVTSSSNISGPSSAFYSKNASQAYNLGLAMPRLDATSDISSGSYTITTALAISADQLSAIVLSLIGISKAVGKVTIKDTPVGDATTDFRLDITLQHSSDETPIMVSVTSVGDFDAYEGLITQTIQLSNLQEKGSSSIANTDKFTVSDSVANAKSDFLFVVDNSGSMSEEQTAVANNATNFFDALINKSLDFKIGVITTDSSTLRGNGFTSDKTQFQSDVSPGIYGSSTETGIYWAEQALSPGGSVVTAGYPRPGASFSVIILSDEPDQYTSLSGGTEFNFTDNIFIQEGYKVYAIISVPDIGCYGDGGSANGSEDYGKLVSATSGAKGSICQSDYSATLDKIIATSSPSYKLTQTPIVSTLSVTVDGTTVPVKSGSDGYLFLPLSNAITFYGAEIPVAGAIIDITYKYVQ
ncbi:MAG: hypothetical protein OEY59_09865 [Deltaproteobacteria bacterium]|nr:hypothetical protein [Deltaproteobacteria bacterium]